MLTLQFREVLVGEGLVVEGERVLVGLVAVNDGVELFATCTVSLVEFVVVLLEVDVLRKLLQEGLAFLTQLLLLLGDRVVFGPLQVQHVYLRIAFELDGEFAVNLGHVDDVVGLLRRVEAVLDHLLLEGQHLAMDLLRKTTVELLHLGDEVELLRTHLLQVTHPPENTLDLLHDVLVLFDRQHSVSIETDYINQ
jgi:hypothetical protein